MIKIITYSDFDVFYEFNDEYLHNNFVFTFYLIKMLEKVREGEIGIYELYNIIDESNSSRFIIGLKVDENYLLNGTNWSSDMLDTLVQKVELAKYKRWMFSGTKSLITELFDKSNCTFHLFKDRLCYKCDRINPAFKPASGELEMAVIEDIDELSEISLAYSISEYQEEARDYQHMRGIVLGGITNKNFFVWRDNGIICSVAQIIYNDGEPPIIGHLYSVESKRNNGYAGSILHAITKNLLEMGHPGCALVSDKTNPASNKVFEKVGYEIKAEHISVSREI
jgi:predicted GNAT family acetyltransferase